jgi:anhydro-N-acetylmuramic acid kinase
MGGAYPCYMHHPPLKAIGLMSGTSLDGIDAAWIETDGQTITRYGPAATLRYTPPMQAELRAVLNRAAYLTPHDVADLTQRLTREHALAVLLLGKGADIIGMHGQTILHDPPRRTWQIGDAPLLARLCHTPVAHDFRSADVAAGGQGAPLAPLFHAALARDLEKPLAIVNIGGVANLTWLGLAGDITACDTGPGNGPLDDLAHAEFGQAFDKDGAIAAAGQVDETRLARLLAHEYFARPAPKSLDRLSFSALIAQATDGLAPHDAMATLAAFTCRAIAAALPAMPARLLVTGGGRHNAALMTGLRALIGCPVAPVESAGWDGDALEAQCFAYLAVRVRYGLPLSLPGTTGVPTPLAGGRIASMIR